MLPTYSAGDFGKKRMAFIRGFLRIAIAKYFPAFGHLLFHPIKRRLVNNWIMGSFHKILGQLTPIVFFPLCQVVNSKRLLEKQVPRHLLITKDLQHCASEPLPSSICRDVFFIQHVCNGFSPHARKIGGVDQANNLRLPRDNCKHAIFDPISVHPQEGTLSYREFLPYAPLTVFTDG